MVHSGFEREEIAFTRGFLATDSGAPLRYYSSVTRFMILRLTARQLSAKCNIAFGCHSSLGVEQPRHVVSGLVGEKSR